MHVCVHVCSKLANARQQREREKDPHVRYEKFLKTAHKPTASAQGQGQGQGQTMSSGSFGGKKKSYRPGARRVVATTTPAWMSGGGEDD